MSPHSPRLLSVVAVTMCAVVAAVSTAGAQDSDSFFERFDNRVGFESEGALPSAAWSDVDGDGDPDLVTLDADGVPTLWRNTGADITPTDLPDLGAGLSAVRWFDADGDGDPDLLTTGAGGAQAVLFNAAGQFGDRVGYGATTVLDHQILDVDGDRQLDLYLGAPEGGDTAASGLVVRRGAGYAPASIEGFLPNESQALVSLYRAGIDDPLELYSGGLTFPHHRFSFDASGPRYLGPITEGTNDVRDVLIGDFDGDLVSEMMLVRGDSGAAVAVNEEMTELSFLISASSSVSSVTIAGATSLDVEVQEQFGLPSFAIQFGPLRDQSDSYDFTVTNDIGDGSRVVRGVDTGLFIEALENDRFRFTLAGVDPVSAVVTISADTPIEMVQALGFPRGGGALFEQFFERNGSSWTRGQSLPSSTECSTGAVGDFDNDMDLDVYLGCGNAIEKTSNRLFLNRGDGSFRETQLTVGGLTDMPGTAGVTVVDADSDGTLDLLVQSSGGSGVFSRSALLRGRANDNHWLGMSLEGVESPTEPIGATVVAETGGVVQRRDVLGGYHGGSQDDSRVHFGVGGNTVVERVTIRWPSGRIQVFDDVAVDQYLSVGEPAADTPFADLRMQSLDVEPVARSGDRLEVVAVATNIGTDTANGAEMVMVLPPGWSAVALPEEVIVEGQTVRWPLPAIAPTLEATVELAVEIEASSGPGSVEAGVVGRFPSNSLSSEVVTGDAVSARFGTISLLLALVAVIAVLGGAAYLVTRRR